MDLTEFINAYHEELAREEEAEEAGIPYSPSTFATYKVVSEDWRYRAEMSWANDFDADYGCYDD